MNGPFVVFTIMKHILFFFLIATFALASCSQPQTPTSPPNDLGYFDYNPDDTIGNSLFFNLLSIDSSRAEYDAEKKVDEYDSTVVETYEQAKAIWFELLDLCSKQRFEEATQHYISHEGDFYIALGGSTDKFELDYYVGGILLLGNLPNEEALERYAKILEFDKFLTESVIMFGEDQSGYVPPHYAFLLETLNNLYILQNNKEKAESLIEPYMKAVYLLEDDSLRNEFDIVRFKGNIYVSLEDWGKAKEAYVEFRDFIIRHSQKTGQDFCIQIGAMDSLIMDLDYNLEEQK